MTVITVTTVGYREVHPMSRAGELFTSVAAARWGRHGCSTRSRWRPRSWSKAACRRASGAAAWRTHDRRSRATLHRLRLRPDRQRSSPTSSPSSRFPSCWSSGIRSACRRRSSAACWRSRPTPAMRTTLRKSAHRACARARRGRRHRRRERLRRPDAHGCCAPGLFIVGRAETEDAERKLQPRRRRSRRLALRNRRAADGADGAAARPSSTS